MVNGKILKIKVRSHSRAIGSANIVAVDFNPRTDDIGSRGFKSTNVNG